VRTPRLLALASLLLAYCSGAESPPVRPPVLLLAVDGLEWSVLLPMVQRGDMPTLRGLMERGVFGELQTLHPTVSPVIWTTGLGITHHPCQGQTAYSSASESVVFQGGA
jgi:hypothetical protein